ncbi:MAG: hypothetical protein ACE14P_06245 [Methanotrichaceae archaeon]
MGIFVKCIRCSYSWETESLACSVTCPRCGKRTPIRAVPDQEPIKAPPTLKARKSLKSQESVQSDRVETLRGKVSKTPTGKIQEDFEVASPVRKHSVRPLTSREAIGRCKICEKDFRENLKLNVMVDEKVKLHASCFLNKIILESNGDLGALANEWQVPLDALQKRAQRLLELGKLTGVLA